MKQRDQIMEVAEDINATGINTRASARSGVVGYTEGITSWTAAPAATPPQPPPRLRVGGHPPAANGATTTQDPAASPQRRYGSAT